MRHSVLLFAALAALLPACRAIAQQVPLYEDPHAPLEARVDDLFGRLTPEEKISLLTGTAFTTQSIPRLGVPAMGMADAGQGVRGGMDSTLGPATLFPAGVTMASTWDPALVGRVGQAIGEEALNKGTGAQVLLGPAINIQRSPLGGRNGEYFSEDPYLAGRLAVGYVQGMQSTGCAACLKHFACNNEEIDRGFVDVQVDERTLREIYLPAFEAGVKEGHAWTVMSSYNRINGRHATANRYLLTDVLKKCWGFDGMVMSDWGAVHETAGVIKAGNDLEMPGPGLLGPARVVRALADRRVTQAQIDDNARRILRTVLRVGLLDSPRTPDHSVVNSPAHRQVAYDAACGGIVLLKNTNHLLPLSAAKLRSIAVIGPAAAAMQYGAAGSPGVQPFSAVSPLAGITARAGKSVTIRYTRAVDNGDPIPASAFTTDAGTRGLDAEYWPNRTLQGQPAVTRTDRQIQFEMEQKPTSSFPRPSVTGSSHSGRIRSVAQRHHPNPPTVGGPQRSNLLRSGEVGFPPPGFGHTEWGARWTGSLHAPVTGRYTLTLTADDGCRLWLDGRLLIDHWFEGGAAPISADVDLVKGQVYSLRVEYFQAGGLASARLNWTLPGKKRFAAAVDAARRSDVAIVCVGTAGTEGEGSDRPSMDLPGQQDALIEAVAAANPHTIVVLNNGTPVTMTRWLGKVPALVEAWFPGEEGGHALASILFGDVNPSGKLPTTLAAAREDYPDYGHFPGVKGKVQYAEGIYVGYRHFDKAHIAPLFPFGYGLSYTTFRYANLRLSSPTLAPDGTVTVRVDITNTGKRTGAEVVELYVGDPTPQEDRPVRELKGFQKVMLAAGETKTVALTLAPRALAYCDVAGKQWKADAGDYTLAVGASSRDLPQTATLHLSADYTEPIPFLGDETGHDANDLALGRPVIASSVENRADVQPSNAVDGDDGTRWSSQFADPQWIAVDLGKPQSIAHVRLTWEDAYASAYQIQTSLDGVTWTDAYTTTTGEGGVEDDTFAPVTARWVRVYCTRRATPFGDSLFSLEVFGK